MISSLGSNEIETFVAGAMFGDFCDAGLSWYKMQSNFVVGLRERVNRCVSYAMCVYTLTPLVQMLRVSGMNEQLIGN